VYSDEQAAGLEEDHKRCPPEGRPDVLATLACRSLVARVMTRRGAVAPSIDPQYWLDSSSFHTWRLAEAFEHRALDISEISGIVEDIVQSCERAKAAGF